MYYNNYKTNIIIDNCYGYCKVGFNNEEKLHIIFPK